MTLYHFTCSHCIGGVARSGLSDGSLVWVPAGSDRMRMDGGWQWLTQEADPARQAWAEKVMLDCNRREWRISIAVPFVEMSKLIRWTSLRKILPADPEWIAEFERPGSEAWFLYRGAIPETWVSRIERTVGPA